MNTSVAYNRLRSLICSMRVAGVEKVKDADLGLCQDGFGINRGETKRDRGPR